MKATVELNKDHFSRFLLYYMYLRPAGIGYLLVGLLALAGGIVFLVQGNKTGIFLIILAVIYYVLQPVMIRTRAKSQANDPRMTARTYYEFKEEGFDISQDGTEVLLIPWKRVKKIVSFQGLYILFFDLKRANIIPKESFSCNTDRVDELILKVMPRKSVKGISA